MTDGWVQITCQEREALVDRLGRSYNGFSQESGIGVHAGSTNMDHGGLIFTEWGYRSGDERPVLRDYRWSGDTQPCRHEVPAAPPAAPSGDASAPAPDRDVRPGRPSDQP